MCTVTYIPTADQFFLTSSRDEQATRSIAIAPASIQLNGATVLFPKDPDAGGTWIAVKENGDTLIILNGAFTKHIPTPPYFKSRGLIVLDIIAHEDPLTYMQKISLENIEPFTLVFFSRKRLVEFRWDGTDKYIKYLRNNQPYIWSSATLYDDETIRIRENWFKKWLINYPQPTQEDIIQFHLHGGEEDAENGINMNRNNILYTVSISAVCLKNSYSKFQYIDTINKRTYTRALCMREKKLMEEPIIDA